MGYAGWKWVTALQLSREESSGAVTSERFIFACVCERVAAQKQLLVKEMH